MKGEREKSVTKPEHYLEGNRESDEAPGQGKAMVFVIVLTFEPGSPGSEPEWRWRVRSVETGEERHFRRSTEVLAYVAAMADVAAPR